MKPADNITTEEENPEKEGKTKELGKTDKAIVCCFGCFGVIFIIGAIFALMSERPAMALIYWGIVWGIMVAVLLGIPVAILEGIKGFKKKCRKQK
ncbi:MAG: hypothetical protein KAU03_00105 [Candidatus Altiarchaeales archaeon]|nr:hypothetical protein [Candidatus Altiarchaeales archaeon]